MIPLSQAVGQQVKCPDCGAPSIVTHSRSTIRQANPGSMRTTDHLWYIVDCPRVGKKLFRATQQVELISEAAHV